MSDYTFAHLTGIIGRGNINLVGKFSLYEQNIRTYLYGKSSLLKLTDFDYKKNEDQILKTIHLLLESLLFG